MSVGGMGVGVGGLGGVGSGAVLGAYGVRKSSTVSNEPEATSFATILSEMIKPAPVQQPEKVSSDVEINRLVQRYMGLVDIFGSNGEYGGQTIEELGKNLQQDIDRFVNDVGASASEYGLYMLSKRADGGGVLFSAHCVDFSGSSSINAFSELGNYLDRDYDRLMVGYMDDMEDGNKRANGFLDAYLDKRDEWEREMQILAARSTFVKFAHSIDGFETQYNQSPEETIGKFINSIDSSMNNTSLTYRSGNIEFID